MQENVSTKCRIGEVRLSYVHIFQPRATTEGGEKKYSLTLLIPKSNTELVAKIRAAIEAAKQAGAATFGGKVPANLRIPLRDGDLERPDDDTYAGCWFINASSKTKPGVVKRVKIDGENKLIEVTNEEDVYSGCYGFASVNFFAYSASGNKGIAAGLNNVLKTRDGEYLGGRASAQTDFGGINLDTYEEFGDDFPE